MTPQKENKLVITAAHNFTAVGHGAVMTGTSVRAGLARFTKYDEYLDAQSNPITVARLRGLDDHYPDETERLGNIVEFCLENLLDEYFTQNPRRPGQARLFLGASSEKRPGPRYEDISGYGLQRILNKSLKGGDLEMIAKGNAAAIFALALAGEVVEKEPETLCMVGAVDSLLNRSTLNWFEKDARLKSETRGRHQSLMPGEAVGFLVIEGEEQARRDNRPVQARIAGIGIAEEPSPRAGGKPSLAEGLTEAVSAALQGIDTKEITAVFCDQNGESSRAREWEVAQMRCFPQDGSKRRVWHPADCYGDIGAASGVVLASIAAQGLANGWLQGKVLVTCSDDHGACGALVMEKEN